MLTVEVDAVEDDDSERIESDTVDVEISGSSRLVLNAGAGGIIGDEDVDDDDPMRLDSNTVDVEISGSSRLGLNAGAGGIIGDEDVDDDDSERLESDTVDVEVWTFTLFDLAESETVALTSLDELN